MKVRAFEIYSAKNIDEMKLQWEDILQIVPMGNKAIVLVKDQAGRNNDKNSTYCALMETYEEEFDKRCKETLYSDFVGKEKMRFSYKESHTEHIDDVRIVYCQNGIKYVVVWDLTSQPEVYKYITFSRTGDLYMEFINFSILIYW